jgi:hypothetical protein
MQYKYDGSWEYGMMDDGNWGTNMKRIKRQMGGKMPRGIFSLFLSIPSSVNSPNTSPFKYPVRIIF